MANNLQTFAMTVGLIFCVGGSLKLFQPFGPPLVRGYQEVVSSDVRSIASVTPLKFLGFNPDATTFLTIICLIEIISGTVLMFGSRKAKLAATLAQQIYLFSVLYSYYTLGREMNHFTNIFPILFIVTVLQHFLRNRHY